MLTTCMTERKPGELLGCISFLLLLWDHGWSLGYLDRWERKEKNSAEQAAVQGVIHTCWYYRPVPVFGVWQTHVDISGHLSISDSFKRPPSPNQLVLVLMVLQEWFRLLMLARVVIDYHRISVSIVLSTH